MMKAILEIGEMPKSCSECNFGSLHESDNGDWCICHALNKYDGSSIIYDNKYISTKHKYYKKRYEKCPLKEMEE